MENVKNISDVEFEIRRAVYIMRALPKEGPAAVSSSWPDYPCLVDSADPSKLAYFRPLPHEIDDMYVVFDWLKVLDYPDRQLLCQRALGTNWKVLMTNYKMSRSGIMTRYKRCLKKVLDKILLDQKYQVKTAVNHKEYLSC